MNDSSKIAREAAPTPAAAKIVAKTIYRELRATGFAERDVMDLASELLALVTAEMRARSPGSAR